VTAPDAIERWEDGTPKSLNNGFTLGILGIPHGYQPAGVVGITKPRPKRGPRQPRAFGVLNGTIHLTKRSEAA
jgi:hypothetical protein